MTGRAYAVIKIKLLISELSSFVCKVFMKKRDREISKVEAKKLKAK